MATLKQEPWLELNMLTVSNQEQTGISKKLWRITTL